MKRSVFIYTYLVLTTPALAQDWLEWRGPTGDHHAPAGATAPVTWDESSNLDWVTPIPGQGHSSPTLVGARIYLTTADVANQTQSLLILDRKNGDLIREVVVHREKLPERIHPNNTHASPTVASDGQLVFTLFHNDAAAWLTAFNLEGEQIWQKRVSEFDPQQYQFGFGSSPRVVGDTVIVTGEYDGPDSGIYALDTATGELRWKTPRDNKITFSTPAVANLGGTLQLLISGGDHLAAYDANNGNQLWLIDGSAKATCGTMVWDSSRNLAFASGGYPNQFTVAVSTQGEPKIIWQNAIKCYEQSMLVLNGHIYAVADSGVAYCWRCDDGEEMWRERLGGKFSSSPLLVDGKIYVSNEGGTTFVYRARPDRYESLGENQLGDGAFATSTPADGRLYHRYFTRSGDGVQGYLAAIGK